MSILRRILLAAIPAGLVAGAALSLVQIPFVLPLVYEAETYEHGAHAAVDDATHAAPHTEPGRSPLRLAFTVLSNLLFGIAGGLLLASAMTLHRGEAGARSGLLWGLSAFVAFSLAPALGLPPELPGAEAASLGARQWWWIGAAAATAGGLALLLLHGSLHATVLGVALLALPHAMGAPLPEHMGGTAPEALARAFVRASLLGSLLFWAASGTAVGALLARQHRP